MKQFLHKLALIFLAVSIPLMAQPTVPVLSTPADADTDVALQPTLDWSVSTGNGAVTYDVEYSINSDLTASTTVQSNNSGADADYTFASDLLVNTTYYWTVNATDLDGTTWAADTFSFTTVPAPPAVGALYTPDGTVNEPLTGISFDWDDATGNGTITYRIEIDNDPAFGSLDESASSLATSDYTSSNTLSTFTTYYWRVIASNAGGHDTSASKEFKTEPAVPASVTLTAPPNTAASTIDTAAAINFTWTSSADTVESYHIIVSSSSGFGAADTVYQNNVTSLSDNVAGTTFASFTQYYWKVIATNYKGSTASSMRTFKTLPTDPGVVTLVGPTDTEESIGVDTTFTWNAAAGNGTVTYKVEVAENSGFSPIHQTLNSGSQTDTMENTTTTMEYYTDYWWRVISSNERSHDTSAVWTFKTELESPNLIDPVNTLTGVSVVPSFKWNSVDGATHYRLMLDSTASYSTVLLDTTIVDTTFETKVDFDNFPLDNGKWHYWKVYAFYPMDTSDASNATFKSIDSLRPTLNYPILGDTTATLNPTFNWSFNNPTGGAYFRLEYSLNSDLTDSTTIDTTVTSFTLADTLTPGTKYYWRVVAISAQDVIINFSDIDSFSTPGSALITAHQSWPIGNPDIYTNDPVLWWYVNSWHNSFTYEVEIKQTSVALTGTPDSTGLTVTYLQMNDLIPGAEYHWAVRVNNGDTTSAFSVDTFTVVGAGNPVQPINSYPVDTAVVYTTAPTFWWYLNDVSQGLEFDLHLEKIAGPGGAHVVDSTNLASLNSQVTGLIAGATYKWYVRSKSTMGGGTSAWSDDDTFTVAGILADIQPIQSWPIDTAVVYTNQPTFWWYLNSSYVNVNSFDIEISTSASFSSTVVDTTVDTVTTMYLNAGQALNYGTTYYWRVRTNNISGGSSAWTGPEMFIVAEQTGDLTPTLTYPTGGVVVYTDDPTLQWFINGSQTSVEYYEVRYSRTSAFVNDTLYTKTDTSSYSSMTLSNLVSGATYYWKVRTYNLDGAASPWSATEEFVVLSGTGNAIAPIVGGPDKVNLDSDSPMLTWFTPVAPEAGQTYTIEYGTSPDMNGAVEVAGLKTGRHQLSGLADGTYYWRVKADKDGSTTGFSGVGTFSVGGVTDVDEDGIIPDKFEVAQNYPNPFNPTTTIRFNLPEASFVTVRIYNMLGQEVRTLVAEELTNGQHFVQWDARNNLGLKVSSGAYIYKVVAGKFTEARKMLLLK